MIQPASDQSDRETNEKSATIKTYHKHPLQDAWTLWYFKKRRGKTWNDCLHFVATVNTVEDFWGLTSFVELPSELSHGCNYSFFKSGIQPKWEDDQNKHGGRWIANTDKKFRTKLNKCWSDLLMAVVGNEFDDFGGEVCGVVVDIKPTGDRLSVWTKDKDHSKANNAIGNVFKKALNLQNVAMIYQPHETANERI